MATQQDVVQRTQALLGDPDGDWATQGYLTPFIDHVYGKMLAYIENGCTAVIEKVVLVSGGAGANQLPQGAGDTIALQRTGGPLWGLQKLIRVDWKQAGQDPSCFTRMPIVGRLPDSSPLQTPQGTYSGQLCCEWRGEKVYMTPILQLIDIQVRGHFRPPRLLKPGDELLDDRLLEPMAEGVAGITGVERGNQNYVLSYGGEAMNTLDDIVADMVRAGQRVKTRLGRTNGSRRGGARRGGY